MLEPPFIEDFASSYSVNMSLLLPDTPYLQPGLCQTVRQIKTEPSHHLMHPTCQGNEPPATLPEYSGMFEVADTPSGSCFIKQEVPEFQEIPHFQMLDTDSERNSFPVAPISLSVGNLHVGQLANCLQTECFPFIQDSGHRFRSSYFPPSPPNSQPPSPVKGKELLHNISPPPSYEASIASKTPVQTHGSTDSTPASSEPSVQNLDQNYAQGFTDSQTGIAVQDCNTAPAPTTASMEPLSPELAQSASAKYNRRNNPDLERRRIHHCDVPGEAKSGHPL